MRIMLFFLVFYDNENKLQTFYFKIKKPIQIISSLLNLYSNDPLQLLHKILKSVQQSFAWNFQPSECCWSLRQHLLLSYRQLKPTWEAQVCLSPMLFLIWTPQTWIHLPTTLFSPQSMSLFPILVFSIYWPLGFFFALCSNSVHKASIPSHLFTVDIGGTLLQEGSVLQNRHSCVASYAKAILYLGHFKRQSYPHYFIVI